jgi:predicted dehydrogenase
MKPERKLRAAVIGVGYLGRFHAQKYMALPDVELVAVVDSDGARAAHVGAELNVRSATDLRSVLPGVDLASIVVSTEHHFPVAQECLEAGVHVLVEKPVSQTAEEAAALIRLAAEKGRVLQVGHVERFNPAIVAAQALLDEPLFIESHRLAPFKPRGTDVNVVLDLMIHDIDIILNLVGSGIADIRPTGFPVLTDDVDIAHARLEFASGCVANVTASRVSQAAMRKIRVFQRDGYLSIDYNERRLVHWKRVRGASGEPRLELDERSFGEADLLMEEVRAFARTVREGGAPVVSGEDGKRALEVALAITRGINHPRGGAKERRE